jgi:predicted nucleic acid-binding protein
MAIVYFDSSALVKLIVEEDGSELAAEVWDRCDAAVSCRLAYPEVRAAIAAAARDHRLDPGAEFAAAHAWEQYWSGVRVLEFSEAVSRNAGVLAGEHGLRGADAVHLASASALDADVVVAVWDQRLASAAGRLGLSTIP